MEKNHKKPSVTKVSLYDNWWDYVKIKRIMEVEKMGKKVHVTSAKIANNKLVLNVDENIEFKNVVAKEQMLVDSDHISFVYILEVNEEFTYIVIPEAIWPTLKMAIEKSFTPVLFNQKEALPLPMFYEELEYLIDNIRGNSNYGEAMVEKVENTF